MKKTLFFLFLLVSITGTAQEFHAWIYFTDKPNVNTALANPLSILTQKSLDRKARHGVSIDDRDVPINQSHVNQIKNTAGISYKAQSKWFNCVHVTGTTAHIDALAGLSFVSVIDYADPTKSAANTDWIKMEKATFSTIDYGASRGQIEMIGLDVLHDAGFTGTGVTIAVTDSGFPNVNINTGFTRIQNQNGILGGYDFVDRNSTFYDDDFHGSRVLSVMAGSNTGNFEGAAPDASYYLFRTEEATQETPAELSYWVAAAERADSLGVDVINVSLGYLTFDNPAENLTYADMNGTTSFISKGANVAFEKGMAVVASAGNSGRSSVHPFIAAPADALGTLSIGAVNTALQRTDFSSTGPTADGRIAPDVTALGSATATINESGVVVGSNGTSFSAPLISAAAACLIQAFPNLTPAQVYDQIRQSSSFSNTPDNLIGYGIPDFGAIYNLLSNKLPDDENFEFYVRDGMIHFNQNIAIKHVELFSLSGQLIWEEKGVMDTVGIQNLKSGIYLMRINGLKSFKIVNTN